MANIKSAKKRILVNRTKAERNKAIKSGVKTAVKKVLAAIESVTRQPHSRNYFQLLLSLTRQLPRVFIIRTLLPEKYLV